MAKKITKQFKITAPGGQATPAPPLGPALGANGVNPGQFIQAFNERTKELNGKVKIKLGAVTASYKGKIRFEDLDEARHVLVFSGEGKDPSGGTARAKITVSLSELEQGSTEMTTDAHIDLTGKVLQVGGGMIKGVSHQLFQRFAKSAKQQLEVAEASLTSSSDGSTASAPAPVPEDEPLRIIPLLLQTLGAAISNFFRRLFGGGRS